MAIIHLPSVDTPEREKPKTSEAQLKAIKKYIDKFEKIYIRVTPELKDSIKTCADLKGKSMTQFIIDAVKKEILNIALSDSDS